MKNNITYTYHQYPHTGESDSWDSFILHPIVVIPHMEATHGVNKTLNMLRRTGDNLENLHTVCFHKRFNTWVVSGNYFIPQALINEAIERAGGEPTLVIYNDDLGEITHSVACENIPAMHGLVNNVWDLRSTQVAQPA